MKTVRDIIIEYLKANGYEGLRTNGCGCTIEDFAVIDCLGAGDCLPAIRRPDLAKGDVDFDVDLDCRNYMGPKKGEE